MVALRQILDSLDFVHGLLLQCHYSVVAAAVRLMVAVAARVKNGEIPDEARAATGKLLIQSNDTREPRKEVPLFGFGKVNKVARPESN
jgi:hypothetical protein